MLSISKPLDAAAMAAYHKKEFAAPGQSYWAKGTEQEGQWTGQLAETLGLSGPVSQDDFVKLAAGIHPKTGGTLVRTRANGEYENRFGETVNPADHRAGWDATFSAPKSISLVALVGGDDRIREAHRQAVTEALTQLERYTHAKLGGNIPAEGTGQFVAATFEHDTARPVDGYAAPQLHTHAVIFNVTQTANDKTRALESKALYETQQFATAVYQTELTLRLRSMGYEIEAGKSGAPEIKGISREYIEASSLRTKQIQDRLTELGFSGPTAAEHAAHETRESKKPLTQEAMMAAHAFVAAQHGNQAEKVATAAKGNERTIPEASSKRIADAVTHAIERNIEREAVVDERLLNRDALRHGMGELTYADVKPEIEARIRERELLEAKGQKYSTGRLLTTPETIFQEKAAVKSVLVGKEQMAPINTQIQAHNFAQSRDKLNDGQRAAIEAVLTNTDRVQGMQGLAGVGKTTTLTHIQDAAQHAGYAVEAVAPTSKAARELRSKGVAADTLQRFLQAGGRNQPQAPDEKKLYILDESSLASTRQMRDFLNKIGPQDRVLVVGDTRQHQGVDAGKPFEQMQDAGMHTTQLNVIVRQRANPQLLAAVEELSKGNTQKGVEMLAEQKRVTEIFEKDARIQAIATAYAEHPASTIAVSPDNASRRLINTAVREELQNNHLMSKEDHTLPTLIPRSDMTGADRKAASHYTPGDIIRYGVGSKDLGIKRGTYATVNAADRYTNKVTVTTEDGRAVTYDPRRLHGISAYQEISRPFAEGDRIQFTAPVKTLDVSNRDMATIQQIRGTKVTARLDGDQERLVTFDAKAMRHFDHGYAVTSHSSQGITADHVLAHVDSKVARDLNSQRFAYVGISRAALDVQVFTDNAAELGVILNREVTKTSAVDFRLGRDQQQEHSYGI